MKIKATLSVLSAVGLVIALTFLPHEIQSVLLDMLNDGIAGSSSTFDTRMLLSNLGHLSVFFTLGFVISHFNKKYSSPLVLTCLIMIAIISELSQFFVIGREPSISDFVINISAVSTGYFLALVRKQPRRRTSRNH